MAYRINNYKQFAVFVESLTTTSNKSIIEAILSGIKALIEGTFTQEFGPRGRTRKEIENKIHKMADALNLDPDDDFTKMEIYRNISEKSGPGKALIVFYPMIADIISYEIADNESLDIYREELFTKAIEALNDMNIFNDFDPDIASLSTFIRKELVNHNVIASTELYKRRKEGTNILHALKPYCMLAPPMLSDPNKPDTHNIFAQVKSQNADETWNIQIGENGNIIKARESDILSRYIPFDMGSSVNLGLIKSTPTGGRKHKERINTNNSTEEQYHEPNPQTDRTSVIYKHLFGSVIANLNNKTIKEIVPNKDPAEIKKFIAEYALNKHKMITSDKSDDNTRTQTKAGNAASAKISQTKAQIIAGLVKDKGESVENAKAILKSLISQKEEIEALIDKSNNKLNYSSAKLKPMVDKMSEQVKGFVYRDTKGKEVVPKWDSNTSKGYEYGDDDVGMRLLDRLYNLLHTRTETTGYAGPMKSILNKYDITREQADELITELNDALKNNETIRQLYGYDRKENRLITQARNRMRHAGASKYSNNPDVDAEIKSLITHGNQE